MNEHRTIKKKEDLIRQLLQESDDLSPAKRAWTRLTEFFSTIDELEMASHTRLIYYLYCRPATKKESMLRVALKHALSESTLYRYRQKYVHCFLMYYQKELAKPNQPLVLSSNSSKTYRYRQTLR